MARAVILMMDSFGVGEAIDAEKFGDTGANTLGSIIQKTHLKLPNLARLGLTEIYQKAAIHPLEKTASTHFPAYDINLLGDVHSTQNIEAAYGFADELSHGKDTPSGHWEMAGLPVCYDWGYFKNLTHAFPEALLSDLIQQAQLPGVLGNCHASGTEILKTLGEEHIQTGKPIVYTSADSVFQIAAHETHFGLEKLYNLCEIARKLVDSYNIGRVIARPFIGEQGCYQRTSNRRDYAMPPHDKTLLDYLIQADHTVISIGKIADIYAHQGISQSIHGEDNPDLFNKTLEAFKHAPDKSLIFTNFVDFDSKYGHRRDPMGYAKALVQFDQALPELEKLLQPNDCLLITADHGCDPCFMGTDHTRERVPIIFKSQKIKPGFMGHSPTFADMGQTLAYHFGLPPLKHGQVLGTWV